MAFPKSQENEIRKQGEEDYKNVPYEDLTSTIECMRVELQILREDLYRAGLADIVDLRNVAKILRHSNDELRSKIYDHESNIAYIVQAITQSAYDAFNSIKRRDVRNRVIKAFDESCKKREKK